jgi:hypothetical protein
LDRLQYGKQIRSTLAQHGVSSRFVKHGSQYSTSVSHILLDE